MNKLTWEQVLAKVSCVRNMPPRRQLADDEPAGNQNQGDERQLRLFPIEATISREQAGTKGRRPC